MTLEEYVLSYTREGEEEPVINIKDYYDRYVQSLNTAYKRYSFKTSRTVVCCFHEDINPSLGTIPDKKYKNVRVFHCFGCGRAGNVIRMHQLIQKQYYKKVLSERESALELCELFNVDVTEYLNLDTKEIKKNAYMDKIRRIQKSMTAYTIRDFQTDLRPAREPSRSMESRMILINNACIKLTATKKKMVDD